MVGSSGQKCVALAEAFPSLDFVVQDFPSAFHGAEEVLPEEVNGRIQFKFLLPAASDPRHQGLFLALDSP